MHQTLSRAKPAADFNRALHCASGAGRHAIANFGAMSLLGQVAPANGLDACAWVQSVVRLGPAWLRPALDRQERRGTGRDAGDRRAMLPSVSPESPAFRACTQPSCEHSRCNGA